MDTPEGLSALGTLIGQQTDQLWSIAMAVIVAEIVVVCTFFATPSSTKRWRWSEWVMLASIFCHGLSLLFGYFSKGAVIELVRGGMGPDAVGAYEAAEVASLWQFGLLVLGLALFVAVFLLKRADVSAAILGGKS